MFWLNLFRTNKSKINQKLEAVVGRTVIEALSDITVSGIYLNDDGTVWVCRYGQPKYLHGRMSLDHCEKLVQIMKSIHNAKVYEKNHSMEVILPDGVHCIWNTCPVTERPTFWIQKPLRMVYPLENYLETGMMTQAQHDAILHAVMNRKNILVVGDALSGKTVLTNTILLSISIHTPEDRILIFEDRNELQCLSPNRSFKRTSKEVDMHTLIRKCLRQNPDRIVVGDVSGTEAGVVLKAWDTGYEGGVVALNANSAVEGLEMFQKYVEEALPGTNMKRAIASAVDLILFITPQRKQHSPPKLHEVVWLDQLEDDDYCYDNVC